MRGPAQGPQAGFRKRRGRTASAQASYSPESHPQGPPPARGPAGRPAPASGVQWPPVVSLCLSRCSAGKCRRASVVAFLQGSQVWGCVCVCACVRACVCFSRGFPAGKSGVCVCVCVCVCVFSCVRLFHDPIDCSPHGSSGHAVAQARILE